ncbi:hypothetical protein MSNKSG1_00681 [Marinobacter santoriniensis NKSG1]|uniref:Transmembrane protein n=1 Tax=Marinobacter santoriniensis NKSG1 TaxID=1288826 RepID=M7DII8_9GAMM|nr:hypothetical protein [Marinobacter santoriniensis]EMP57477.1 hypothetical protein MSNKSG1_00681 [Marinobacter santoriniensis NKSG1]
MDDKTTKSFVIATFDFIGILPIAGFALVLFDQPPTHAFYFGILATLIARVWAIIYDWKWGMLEDTHHSDTGWGDRLMNLAGFELVAFLAFTSLVLLLTKSSLGIASLSGAALVILYTVYWSLIDALFNQF